MRTCHSKFHQHVIPVVFRNKSEAVPPWKRKRSSLFRQFQSRLGKPPSVPYVRSWTRICVRKMTVASVTRASGQEESWRDQNVTSVLVAVKASRRPHPCLRTWKIPSPTAVFPASSSATPSQIGGPWQQGEIASQGHEHDVRSDASYLLRLSRLLVQEHSAFYVQETSISVFASMQVCSWELLPPATVSSQRAKCVRRISHPWRSELA